MIAPDMHPYTRTHIVQNFIQVSNIQVADSKHLSHHFLPPGIRYQEAGLQLALWYKKWYLNQEFNTLGHVYNQLYVEVWEQPVISANKTSNKLQM